VEKSGPHSRAIGGFSCSSLRATSTAATAPVKILVYCRDSISPDERILIEYYLSCTAEKQS